MKLRGIGHMRFTLMVAFGAMLVILDPRASAQNPIPYVNQPLVPAGAAPGGGQFVLTVNGAGFVSSSVVKWNGVAKATTFVSNAKVTATIPASDIATAKTAWITVTSPSPGGGTSNVVFFPVTASHSVTFSRTDISTGSPLAKPQSVITGDFNGDGKLDIAVANAADNTPTVLVGSKIAVFLGNGNGTFPSPVFYSTGPHSFPFALVTGDFNNDGKADLAVADEGVNRIVVLLGNGNGTFQSFIPTPVATNPNALLSNPTPMSLTAGDFNRDGKLDLAVGNYFDAAVALLVGTGDGHFQSTPAPPLDACRAKCSHVIAVAAGDFTGDGILDLVALNHNFGVNSQVAFMAGKSDGTFVDPVIVGTTLVGQDPTAMLVADADGGGVLDIVLTSTAGGSLPPGSPLNTGSGRLLTGGGPQTFTFGGNFDTTLLPNAITGGDFDGNAKLDWAIAGGNFPAGIPGSGIAGFGNVSLLLKGGGTYTRLPDVATGNFPSSIAVGDFNSLNNDGKLDLVVANLSDGTISVLLQQ